MLQLLASSDPLEHVLPHALFWFGDSHHPWFVFTNQMLMALIAAALMLLIFPRLFNKATAEPPTGARNFFEAILEFLRVEVFRPALKEHTDRFVPYLWTLFFFILFCNLLGQIPFGEIITLFKGTGVKPDDASHLGGTATGTLITTGALAVCTFFFIHANGIAQVARSLIDGTYGHHGHHEEHSSDGSRGHEAAHDLDHHRGEGLAADVPQDFDALKNPSKHYGDDQHVGHHHAKADDGHLHGGDHGHGQKVPANVAWLAAFPLYLWNFAPHPFKPGPGESGIKWFMDVPMWGFLLILELVGAIIKPFALSIRLFANMIAGHIVLAALIGLIPLAAGIGVQLAIGGPVTVLSLLIRVLELFVAFLQAYIFTFLSTLFIASAVAPEH
jgi:F0F1-type ATP synthase membrane subunit a